MRAVAVLLLVVVLAACAPRSSNTPLLAAPVAPKVDNGRLNLFGGPRHRKFLGCLTCSRYEADSLWNPYGTYGNPHGIDSIWNPGSVFGSEHSQFSPWNERAADPPVVLDLAGYYYGRFTTSRQHPQRTMVPALVRILDSYQPRPVR